MKHVFKVKAKAEQVKPGNEVPGHTQFGFIETIDQYTWKAFDKLTGKEVIIFKKAKGKYIHFDITYKEESL